MTIYISVCIHIYLYVDYIYTYIHTQFECSPCFLQYLAHLHVPMKETIETLLFDIISTGLSQLKEIG